MTAIRTAATVSDNDNSQQLIEQVKAAYARQSPLSIIGANSREFLANQSDSPVAAQTLSVADHSGVISYEPTELVITARAGTRVADLEAVLHAAGQMLPFEPTRFHANSTLGGVVASGLSGPARPYSGSVRDYVLGVSCINGRGEDLSFGGQVMKNVAGYDLSRLMTGAWGTLGVITQVSFKVLPRPECVQTQQLHMPASKAIETCNTLAASPWPITGAMHVDGVLHLRLSGSEGGVQHAARELGGEVLADDSALWRALRDWQLPVLASDSLWRLSLPSTTPDLTSLTGRTIIDWGGAQRWYAPDTTVTDKQIREAASSAGGHAWHARGAVDTVFSQPPAALAAVHQRLKDAFDPARLFNPNRYITGL